MRVLKRLSFWVGGRAEEIGEGSGGGAKRP